MFNKWTQSLFHIVGAVVVFTWGAYTFVYKEVYLPKAAPINISINLDVQKLATNAKSQDTLEHGLLPVRMKVVATNPSSRTVYVLPNAWMAEGVNLAEPAVSNGQEDPNVAFVKKLEAAMNDKRAPYVLAKHSEVISSSLVAGGRLLEDDVLRPGESVMRTIIFYIPRGEYDSVDITAVIPTAGKDPSAAQEGGVELRWKVSDEDGLIPTFFRVDREGQKAELITEKHAEFLNRKFEMQQTVSRSTLPLWQ